MKKILRKKLEEIRFNAPYIGHKARPISIEYRLRRLNTDTRKQIQNQHQAALTLFDEALKFVIAFEDFHYERKERTSELTPFITLLSRVRADLVAIRQLLMSGQESAALALARVFIEDIELTMAAAVEHEFATAYMDTESPDAFWSNRIAYGKIYPHVERFLHLGRSSEEAADAHLQHHRALKKFLSNHVHLTFNSALRTVTPPVLEKPGHFAFRPLGWFGENSARLCLSIADEIQIFSSCCINAFISPTPPPAMSNYKPSRLMSQFLLHAHTLQSLTKRYSSRINASYDRSSTKWYKQLDNDK